MDNMYDVFVLIVNYYDDLIIYADDYVDDEMRKNENDEMTNKDLYWSEKGKLFNKMKEVKHVETTNTV